MTTIRKFLLTLALVAVSALTAFGQQPKVSYAVGVCNAGASTKLTSARAGGSYDLVCWVQDLRPSGTWVGPGNTTRPLVRGVFAAYCDVLYDPKLVKLTFDSGDTSAYLGCFTFSPNYQNGKLAYPAADRIDNVGAFTGSFGGNTAPVEVWRVRITLKTAGGLSFKPSLADVPLPMCATLVYGNDGANPPEQSNVTAEEVVLVPCAITINP